MTFTINDGSLQKKCLLCSKPLLGKRIKFCSKNCGDKVSNAGRHLRVTKPPLKNCKICEKELVGKQRSFCSQACSQINSQNLTKNPLSTYGTGKRKQMVYEPAASHSSYDESHLPQSVELYIANLPDQPFTEEDQRYLNRCLEEMGPATIDEKIYVSPHIKAKQDGLYSDFVHHSAFFHKAASVKAYWTRINRKDY